MCAEAGADMIGLNFYPKSPRCIERPVAVQIAAALRARPNPPTLVGVFVDESPQRMTATLGDCGLDVAQLSGDEPDAIVQALGRRAFKAWRINSPQRQAQSLPPQAYPHRPDFLIDAHVPGKFGGTGEAADWEWAAEVARRARVLLAGGLTPDNVAEAIRRVRPWGVDVASGVESSPGLKDAAKVKAFIEAARHRTNDRFA